MVSPEEVESRGGPPGSEIVPGIGFIPDFDKLVLPGGGSKGEIVDRVIIEGNWKGACGYFRRNAREMQIGRLFDWNQEVFELRLRDIATALRSNGPRSVIASRRALGAGELKDKNTGVWVFTKRQLIYVMVGARAYSYHWLGQKKQQTSEPAPTGSI